MDPRIVCPVWKRRLSPYRPFHSFRTGRLLSRHRSAGRYSICFPSLESILPDGKLRLNSGRCIFFSCIGTSFTWTPTEILRGITRWLEGSRTRALTTRTASTRSASSTFRGTTARSRWVSTRRYSWPSRPHSALNAARHYSSGCGWLRKAHVSRWVGVAGSARFLWSGCIVLWSATICSLKRDWERVQVSKHRGFVLVFLPLFRKHAVPGYA